MLGQNHVPIDNESKMIRAWLEGDGGRQRIFVFTSPTAKSAAGTWYDLNLPLNESVFPIPVGESASHINLVARLAPFDDRGHGWKDSLPNGA
jgi:hypothetical protein